MINYFISKWKKIDIKDLLTVQGTHSLPHNFPQTINQQVTHASMNPKKSSKGFRRNKDSTQLKVKDLR